MENALSIFEKEEFGQVRTSVIDGEIWFVALDVCRILGHTNPRRAIHDYVYEEDRTCTEIVQVEGGRYISREMTLINEPGLYSLIFSSKVPFAKEFQYWVFHEVLPSIRKKGYYITKETINDILLEKQREDDTFVDAIDKQAIKRAVIAEKREAGYQETVKLFAEHFDDYDRITFINELKRIWKGDVVSFHKYRDKYDTYERQKQKHGSAVPVI